MISLDSQNEKTGFAAVYEAWYDRVFKYAYTLLLNRDDAEDVTADTFIAAYTSYGRYDAGKSSVGTWLTRIAHNTAVNLMRSAAYAQRTELAENWDVPDEGSDFTGSVEAADTVLRLYARLTPEERELLKMRCVMEMRDREIAELLQIPEKTVNKRYHRLLAKCRTLLNGEKTPENQISGVSKRGADLYNR